MFTQQLTPEQFLTDQSGIDRYLIWPWSLLLASIAIGFLTMTIQEGFKANSRYQFSQRELADWLYHEYGYPGRNRHWLMSTFRRWWLTLRRLMFGQRFRDSSDLIRYLVLVSTAGNQQALFSLPLENLCGQLALGVQSLLDSRDGNAELIAALIGKGFDLPGVRERYDQFIVLRADRRLSEELQDDYMESRGVIATMIQRNIDSFQILATYRWKRYQRERAFGFSLVIASLGSLLFAAGRHPVSWIFVVLFLSYIGAFFALFISDMVDLARKRADAL